MSDGLPRQAKRAVVLDERRRIVDSRRDPRTSGFVEINPNSKIPALMDRSVDKNAPGNISSRMNAATIFNDSLSHHMNMVAT